MTDDDQDLYQDSIRWRNGFGGALLIGLAVDVVLAIVGVAVWMVLR